MWLVRETFGSDGPCRVCGGDLYQEFDYEARRQLQQTGVRVMKCLMCGREYDYDLRRHELTGPLTPEVSARKFTAPAARRTKLNLDNFEW